MKKRKAKRKKQPKRSVPLPSYRIDWSYLHSLMRDSRGLLPV